MSAKTSKPKARLPLSGPIQCSVFEHRKGLSRVPKEYIDEVMQAVLLPNGVGSTAPSARKVIIENLANVGWPEGVKITAKHDLSVTSIKKETALCLQTGNTGRMYADMLKLQKLFHNTKINSGIIAVPTKGLTRVWGRSDANLVNSTRLISELELFADIVTVPLVIIAISTPEEV